MEDKKYLKMLIDKGFFSNEQKKELESIIPELAESDDERIATRLIHLIHTGGYLEEPSRTQVLAWLEKQKEKKSVEWNKATINGEPISSENKAVDIPCIEWSEEDEIDLNDAIKYVQNYGETSSDVYTQLRTKEIVEWLKSIHHPFKDKEMKLKILKYLSTCCSSLEFEEVEEYLNNLHPHWKPSKEQMNAFRSYIKDFQEKAEAAVGGWDNFDVMIQLFEQLQKLK